MIKKTLLLSLFISLFIFNSFSQVGIGTTNPDVNSVLDIVSADKGLLIPRVNFINLPSNLPAGFLVYVTSNGPDGNNAFYYNTGSEWRKMIIGINTVAPLVSTTGVTPGISIPEASATQNGYLKAADWITFNNMLPKNGGLMTGKINTMASTASCAGINIPHGTAPSAPVDGDIWTTTSGLFARINGVTTGPFGTSATLWSLNGNSGTLPATNFIGTTDAQPLVVRTSNTERLRILSSGLTGIATSTPNSTLTVNGSLSLGYKNITAAYTATDADFTIASGNTVTVSLPQASTCTGRLYCIVATASNSITVDPYGTETFRLDGAAVTTITVGNSGATTDSQDQCIIQSAGTGWIILSLH